MTSLAPGFLVAAPILRDPNFVGSVVLMVEHSEQGALGFVVNRESKRDLRNVLAALDMGDTPIERHVPVMIGGPVSPTTSWIVFETDREPELREDVLMVTDHLGVGASVQFLVDAVRGDADGRAMLVQGYARWAPGQLESELRLGVWLWADLDARVIFDTAPSERWAAALSVLGVHPAALPRTQVALA